MRLHATAPEASRGTLAFFCDCEWVPWQVDPSGGDALLVRYAGRAEPLRPIIPPAGTPDDFVRPAAGVRVAREETPDDPFHRLLGEPDPIQHDPLEGEWSLLLQLDSGEPLELELADWGRLYFVMRPMDLARHRWERVRVVMQSY